MLRRDLEVLSVHPKSEISSEVTPDLNLPSWVPGWMCLSLTTNSYDGSLVHDFHACGDSCHVVEFFPNARKEVLCLRGHQVDYIKIFGKVMTSRRSMWSKGERNPARRNIEVTRNDHVLWSEWVKIADLKGKKPYPTGESNMDVFWKTLTGNSKPMDYNRTRTEYLNWLKESSRLLILQRLKLHKSKWIYFLSLLLYLRMTTSSSHNMPSPPNAGRDLSLVGDRSLARTAKGYLSLVPGTTKPGDSIVILKGGRTPLVLRKELETTSWRPVGDAYVHGMMNGEVFQEGSVSLCASS